MKIQQDVTVSCAAGTLKKIIGTFPYLAVMGMIWGYLAAALSGVIIGLLIAAVCSVIIGTTTEKFCNTEDI